MDIPVTQGSVIRKSHVENACRDGSVPRRCSDSLWVTKASQSPQMMILCRRWAHWGVWTLLLRHLQRFDHRTSYWYSISIKQVLIPHMLTTLVQFSTLELPLGDQI